MPLINHAAMGDPLVMETPYLWKHDMIRFSEWPLNWAGVQTTNNLVSSPVKFASGDLADGSRIGVDAELAERVLNHREDLFNVSFFLVWRSWTWGHWNLELQTQFVLELQTWTIFHLLKVSSCIATLRSQVFFHLKPCGYSYILHLDLTDRFIMFIIYFYGHL